MTTNFDLEQAIKALQSGQDLTGKDGFLTPLIKQIIEAALKAELDIWKAMTNLTVRAVPPRKL